MTVDPAELLSLAVRLGTEGGDLAVRMREGVAVSTKTTPVDVVTAADKAVELFIQEQLASARPGDGFIGEESAASASTTGIHWVVDPIDGTVNYLYRIPQWAVSIAAVVGDDPATWTVLAGVVVNPLAGEVWTATLGGGAALNGVPLHVNPVTELATSLVATGFGYSAETRRIQGQANARVVTKVRDLRRMGAASLDLCAVAAGRLDAYFERGLMPWDFAAGQLIAAEAGAMLELTDVRDGRRLVVAAAPGIAEALAALLAEAGA